jgi:hypothetical protein
LSRPGNTGSTVTSIREKEEIPDPQPRSDDGQPVLTVQQVSDAWENVIKRTRQKTSPAMLSMLRPCKIIGVERRSGQTVVVVQFDKEGHYNYLKANERYKFLEWALTTEFQIPCVVRLVPPGQSVLLPSVADPVSYSTSVAPAIAPQQSAFLERPVSPLSPIEHTTGAQNSLSRISQTVYEDSLPDAASLTGTGFVKENISVVEPQDTIEQKVHRDPVVQEVIKTFSARIIEVRPK